MAARRVRRRPRRLRKPPRRRLLARRKRNPKGDRRTHRPVPPGSRPPRRRRRRAVRRPLLQRFGRQLMRRWIPPPAYAIGLLKDGGWAVFELEISRAGEILRLQVLEEHGHPLLRQASEGALRNMHPIE